MTAASLSPIALVRDLIAQAKVIRSHDHAVQAKWLANLIRRLKDVDLDKPYALGNATLNLGEIASRLEDACYGGTPEANIETIGEYGASPEAALNLGRLMGNLRATLLHTDKSVDWKAVNDIVAGLGANYDSITREACERFGFTWQEREQLRLVTGQYKPLPWAKELKPVPGHFAHLSTKEKGLLAYTENDDKGGRDVQKRIKPGKYLNEHYPDLKGTEVEKLQGKVIVTELQFTNDPDLIEKLYREGPNSCMSGSLGTTKGFHPARCYGGGDLALAYLLDKKTGKCSARAVVWPDKKVYYTFYGDIARLQPALTALGYKNGGAYCFQGARMRKQRHSQNYIIMASFDGHGRFSLDPKDDDFIIVDRNGPLAGHSPRMHIPEAIKCQCGCGKKDYNPLPVLADGPAKPPQQWINACLAEARKKGTIVQCHASGSFVRPEDTAQVHWAGRGLTHVLKSHRQTRCVRTATGEWYRVGSYHLISLDNGDLWELEDLRKSPDHVQDKTGYWTVKEANKKAA